MSFKIISLFLILALLSPIRSLSSEESSEESSKDSSEDSSEESSEEPKSSLDMFNKIEDGGYGEEIFVVYDYSQGQGGKIAAVLQVDLSLIDADADYPPLDYEENRTAEEEFDWSLLSSSSEEVEDNSGDAVLTAIGTVEVTEVDYDYDKSTEISQNVIVGREDLLNMEKDDIVGEYEYVDNFERIEEAMQVTMDNVYDQAMVFHIILLLGICLICLVVFFALVGLVVTILTRRQEVDPNPVRTIKIKSDGIVKSYAKIPVEIKNMVPSNIAYKPLYDV